MKFFLVALSLIAVCNAGVVSWGSPSLTVASPWAAKSLVSPLATNWGAAPLATTWNAAPLATTWNAAPLATAWNAAPLATAWNSPLALASPALVPAVQPGYVAATRGSLHVAPLVGSTLSSQHLNLAPAPGTW